VSVQTHPRSGAAVPNLAGRVPTGSARHELLVVAVRGLDLEQPPEPLPASSPSRSPGAPRDIAHAPVWRGTGRRNGSGAWLFAHHVEGG
jgi:hypothetical protein